MDFFSVVELFGGLALFLYGMNVLGTGLEKISGGRLEKILENLTSNIFKSILFGALVTAAVQSSSATTVIVVGLVNSRILKLNQAIGVIMGANIGTTITAHILSLADISSDNFLLRLIKPSTLAPVAAIIGILLLLLAKNSKKKNFGQILLAFGVLFTGMFNMEGAVHSLRDHPAFAEMFASFSNPIVGVLVGAGVTALIQSSSASVGILQALSTTGQITYSSAFPIIMGQNIGTCITPILASIGASKNAKRSAVVHLCFNIIGTMLFLMVTYGIHSIMPFSFWDTAIDRSGIANFHTIFNISVTLSFIPFVKLLEKLAMFLIKDNEDDLTEYDITAVLDERFFVSPGLAIKHSRDAVIKMGELAKENFLNSAAMIKKFDSRTFDISMEIEDILDTLEDKLNIYLLNLSHKDLTVAESKEVSLLLHIIGEYERIGDYAINILEESEVLHENKTTFSEKAMDELNAMMDTIIEIIDMANSCFVNNDQNVCIYIESLEEVVDIIEERLKSRHVDRLKSGKCGVDSAFPFIETLSNLERIADHCSNIGLYIATYENNSASNYINMHSYVKEMQKVNAREYENSLLAYKEKYLHRID